MADGRASNYPRFRSAGRRSNLGSTLMAIQFELPVIACRARRSLRRVIRTWVQGFIKIFEEKEGF